MEKNDKIYVAGHRGLVGSAILRRLQDLRYDNVILRTHAELDLLNQRAVEKFFAQEKPDYVFMAAAKVGGIHANNTYPADFLYQNVQIQNNVLVNAANVCVKKLLFLGSSCIYPKLCRQPMKEEYLLTGPLEPTNEPYAIAKICGIKLCEAYNKQYSMNFISVMPTNMYGPGDNFDLENSHVLPALIRKFVEAQATDAPSVTVWGSGTPRRELMHVDDLADAVVFLMRNYDEKDILNIGTGIDHTILEIAEMVKDVVGFQGDIVFDATKPDGTPQKLLDVSRIRALGWTSTIPLREGIKQTVAWFREHQFRQ